MSSLRRQLLAWLVPVFAAVALVAALATYFSFGRTVNWFMDQQVRALVEAQVEGNGLLAPLDEYQLREKGAIAIQVWEDGALVATSAPMLRMSRQVQEGFHDVEADGEPWRVYVSRSGARTLQGLQSLSFREHVIRGQALSSGVPILLLIPVTALLIWWVVLHVMRRVENLSSAAAERDAHNLKPLPDEQAPTEIQPLVRAVNRLLARLESAFDAQRRFVQDAAHELRTPLAALSLQLENVRARSTDSELERQVDVLGTGVARMKRLVDQLLRLARQDAPATERKESRLDICAILRETVAELLSLAERRRIDLGLQVHSTPIAFGNADEIRSVLQNLIDNALRYSPEGSSVEIVVEEAVDTIEIKIVDEGPGIPEEQLTRVFGRFVRIEGSDVEGSGLGLAIAKRAAERNRATLSLVNRRDRSGLIASLRMRRCSEHEAPREDEDGTVKPATKRETDNAIA